LGNSYQFFKSKSKYENFSELISDLAGDHPYAVVNSATKSIKPDQRTFFVPFFGGNCDIELKNPIESTRDTLLYKALMCLFKAINMDK